MTLLAGIPQVLEKQVDFIIDFIIILTIVYSKQFKQTFNFILA